MVDRNASFVDMNIGVLARRARRIDVLLAGSLNAGGWLRKGG